MGDFAKDNQLMAVFQTEAVYYLRRSGPRSLRALWQPDSSFARRGLYSISACRRGRTRGRHNSESTLIRATARVSTQLKFSLTERPASSARACIREQFLSSMRSSSC